MAPGLIFADDDDVAPDVVWLSSRRMSTTVEPDGKLHAAPELIVEVLSPGSANEKRDREAKLKLYSRRGVDEYWIIDWRRRNMQVFRREDARLVLTATLAELLPMSSDDALGSGIRSTRPANQAAGIIASASTTKPARPIRQP